MPDTITISSSLLWSAATVVFAIGTSWATVKATQRHMEQRVRELELDKKERQLSGLAIAGALTRIETMDNRLERIEDLMLHELKVARDRAG